jgi:hypothetical protein
VNLARKLIEIETKKPSIPAWLCIGTDRAGGIVPLMPDGTSSLDCSGDQKSESRYEHRDDLFGWIRMFPAGLVSALGCFSFVLKAGFMDNASG